MLTVGAAAIVALVGAVVLVQPLWFFGLTTRAAREIGLIVVYLLHTAPPPDYQRTLSVRFRGNDR